jgi:hypothetical protein
MVDLNGHEAGNGGHSQRTPTANRGSSTREDPVGTSGKHRLTINRIGYDLDDPYLHNLEVGSHG